MINAFRTPEDRRWYLLSLGLLIVVAWVVLAAWGASPYADLLDHGKRPRGWALDRDPLALETSAPGMFAAGDVRHGSTKRVAGAVGEGAMAVALAHRRLEELAR